jgi:nucleoside-diphosphate-sugar epimerase
VSLLAVTGATGFVGRALVARLASENRAALAIVRNAEARVPGAAQHRVVPGLEADRAAWKEALQGVSMVVHLAARAHVMREAATDPLAEFRRVNVDGTLNLAQQAVAAGV